MTDLLRSYKGQVTAGGDTGPGPQLTYSSFPNTQGRAQGLARTPSEVWLFNGWVECVSEMGVFVPPNHTGL